MFPEIKNIKLKMEENRRRFQETNEVKSEPYTDDFEDTINPSKVLSQNKFVKVFVRVRPFMKFEFRDKHKSKQAGRLT
jgi:hypothetical protein